MLTTASISGMTCAHCVRAVFTSLSGLEGIKRADVTIGKVVIEHDGTVTPQEIREANYDLSLSKYKVRPYVAQEYEAPAYFLMLRRSVGLGPARRVPIVARRSRVDDLPAAQRNARGVFAGGLRLGQFGVHGANVFVLGG